MSTPSKGLARHSLVSIWRDQSDSKIDYFECSGVFVGNGIILTVKHAFKDKEERWVRPYADAAQTYPIIGTPILHPDLDAALICIEQMPFGSMSAILDVSNDINSTAQSLSLNGYFEGRCETAYPVQWLSFDAYERYHILSVKQPKGHSGSGLANGDRLWGITIGHFSDPNIDRGCAISIKQLWTWLEKHVTQQSLKIVNAKETPRHDVLIRSIEIKRLIANNDLESANLQVMDFVRDFPTNQDIDESVLISIEIREANKYELGFNDSVKHRVEIARRMLALINGVIQRLEKEINDE